LCVRRREMTGLTDRIDVGAQEQMRIRTAMRKVTCGAALGLYNRVFKQKRPGSRGVAIRAEGVLPARRSWTLLLLGAMRIVAICALNEPVLDIVARRHLELNLDLRMAAIAELRLVDF